MRNKVPHSNLQNIFFPSPPYGIFKESSFCGGDTLQCTRRGARRSGVGRATANRRL